MKYLVVKAHIGFGDRLESLKMYVDYCLKNGVSIYVDWSDDIWTHSTENFYTYFSLQLPTFALEDVKDLDVFPPYWKGRLTEKLTKEVREEPTLNLDRLEGSYPTDVVVVTSAGYRKVFSDNTFFSNVFRCIHPTVFQKVRHRQLSYRLDKKIGIHLRGSDRANYLDKGHRMKGIGIRMVTEGLLRGKEFVAVSDDPEFIKLWKARYKFPILSEINISASQGLHHLSKDQLSVSKHDLNIDMLVDFFTLASCEKIISTDKDSRFTHEACRLRPYIKRILNY